MVTGGTFITGRCRKYKYLEQELYKLYISQCNNIKELSWRTSQPILVIIPRSFNIRMLIKTISNNNCPNIEQLSTYLVPEDFDYVKSLLLNCKNLIYLGLNSLDYFTDMNDENDII
uniref:Uncharacterized protein n=1 Tax=Rhizophagus irregularis (strain DAOM 181602 / DAOM 197198 / MUCL 43194) TaxID=747089 RepID=U9TIF4_RHIID